jgi:hypothetical protein
VFEVVFVGRAREVYDTLPDADLAEVNAIVDRIEADPWGDDEVLFTVVLAGEVMGIYDDGRWEVAFRVVEDAFLEVVGLSKLAS